MFLSLYKTRRSKEHFTKSGHKVLYSGMFLLSTAMLISIFFLIDVSPSMKTSQLHFHNASDLDLKVHVKYAGFVLNYSQISLKN